MRTELNIPAGDFIFGDVGHDKPEKGVERLLRAYAKALPQLPPSTLVVVGLKSERWQHLADELGIADKVRLITRTENVANYVQLFSLFVFPSYFIESQPNVIMEAMSMGKPVIGSDIGHVKNMLGPACVFLPGDVEAMARMMIKVSRDEEFLREAARGNLERSRAFSTEIRLNTVLGIYRSVLAENGL
jgi:glycosyltransferase involved in cell wall biosynthesis